jgi:hypothetical protein
MKLKGKGGTIMTTEDFIIELFCRIDDAMKGVPKHSQSKLYPSEIVTLAILFAIKGVGQRAFYRWLKNNFSPLFPNCQIEQGCLGFSRLIKIGRISLWLNLPS